jgi:general secretion pathway protein E
MQGFLDHLLDAKLISPSEFKLLADHATRYVARQIAAMNIMDTTRLGQAVADYTGLPFVPQPFDPDEIDPADLIQTPYMAQNGVVAFMRAEEDGTDYYSAEPEVIEELCHNLSANGRQTYRVAVCPIEWARAVLERTTRDTTEATGANAVDEVDVSHLLDLASEVPTIKKVNHLITEAIQLGASDIHVEPFEDRVLVRYRVDGVLETAPTAVSRAEYPAILSRLKILSGMNIAERRLPQDGRITTKFRGTDIDIRVSSVPTAFGESSVLRILENADVEYDLDLLGFPPAVLSGIKERVQRPNGILLVTGPTGSGKTTTLYAMLQLLNTGPSKLLTLEDPIEFRIPGVNQVQINEAVGMSFAKGLRTLLRQDPDVIMVGEIRDEETARIAMQASLTGHLVLSTLHTNDSLGAIYRLIDMGIEHFLIAASLLGVLSQRLVRRLCAACREPIPAELPENRLIPGLRMPQTMFRGRGCPECRHTGYRGRLAIYEFLALDGAVRQAIAEKRRRDEVAEAARQHGLVSLFEAGLAQVEQGATTLNEVLRVAHADVQV